MEHKVAAILGIVLLAALFTNISYSQGEYIIEECKLTVYPDGYVLVNLIVKPLNDSLTITVKLIGEPDDTYGIIILDENQSLIAYEEIDSSSIRVYVIESKLLNISYFTATLTTKDRDIWVLQADLPIEAVIILPEYSVITDLSEVPLQIDVRDNKPIIIMPEGSIRIEYTIPPPVVVTPQPSESKQQPSQEQKQEQQPVQPQNQTTPTGTGQTTGEPVEPSSPEEKETTNNVFYIIVGVAIAAIIFAGILVMRKLRVEEEFEELREDEVEILKALRSLGGHAFQSEVAKLVDQPTTTLWRNIRRLSNKGYIRIEKRFGRNYLILIR